MATALRTMLPALRRYTGAQCCIHAVPVARRGACVPATAARRLPCADARAISTITERSGDRRGSESPSGRLTEFSDKLRDGPQLGDFLSSHGPGVADDANKAAATPVDRVPLTYSTGESIAGSSSPTPATGADTTPRGSFYIETYGCQMNVSDTEIIHAVLQSSGFNRTHEVTEADVILTNTCAIRDNAEQKVWNRLGYFRSLKRKRPKKKRPVVGVLGCMAERLKTKLLEGEHMVDLVVGPDAYRDLPSLIDVVKGGENAANVQLSVDETYADLTPVRSSETNVAAYLSIMRGCNNMCSFCVVPFTRGRERSRPVGSIEDEVRMLRDEGFKEVLLLGQNVNSFHDKSTPSSWDADYVTSRGFSNLYMLRGGSGVYFAELVDRLSMIAPEMRFRFTSPHPKDFPDPLLSLMKERPNVCNSIHMPAQSGNSAVLKRMRRGYTREAYLELVDRIRETIPGVALSSDFISGFCDETEEEHRDTVTLMEHVQFEQAFMFAYSLRDKTHAYHRMQDNVPEDVKLRRLQEVIATFRKHAEIRNQQEVGRYHLLLVEGPAKRSTEENPQLVGRVDNNKRCLIPDRAMPPTLAAHTTGTASLSSASANVHAKAGDYVLVRVASAGVTTLIAEPVARTTIMESATFSDLLQVDGAGLK